MQQLRKFGGDGLRRPYSSRSTHPGLNTEVDGDGGCDVKLSCSLAYAQKKH